MPEPPTDPSDPDDETPPDPGPEGGLPPEDGPPGGPGGEGPNTEGGPTSGEGPNAEDAPTPEDLREELEGEGFDTGNTREQFDENLIDVLSWGLETETRGRIYVALAQRPRSTSEEIAQATGLYPSTVREALAALYEEAIVERRKRPSAEAGNDPYEYTAIAPSELVTELIGRVREGFDTVFDLEGGGSRREKEIETGRSEPVTIDVENAEHDDGEEGDASGDDRRHALGEDSGVEDAAEEDSTDDEDGPGNGDRAD